MCDYSLEVYRTRPARAGERYVTHRFPSGSIGLVSPSDCATAVCMPRDARLRLDGLPAEMRRLHGLGPSEEAEFIYLDAGPYHDGLRFANGVEVSLQRLRTGVGAFLTEAVDHAAQLDLAEAQ